MRRIFSIILAVIMVASIVPVTAFSKVTEQNDVFFDVNGNEYYAQAAEALSKLGILKGYEEEAGFSFGAEKSITRAEMAAIVCRMIDKEDDTEEAKGETIFDDVSSDHWASGYINIASDDGIINGDGDGKFRPEDDVKHEEAIKMIVCAFGYGDDVEVDPEDWSCGYLEIADEKAISVDLRGTKGDASTRGDVAVMTYNALATETADSKVPCTPAASKEAGEYKGTQKVKLSTLTEDAEIYYTTDGTEPTENSTRYTKEISISKTSILKAIAIKDGVTSKNVLSVEYTIKKSSSGGGVSVISKPTVFTVSFDLNYEGAIGAPVNQNIRNGNKVTEPTAPERVGYTFLGWSLLSNGGQFFDFNTKIRNNITLYAIWEITEYAEQDPDSDADNDGISYEMEMFLGLDPNSDDTDGDSLSDYLELTLGTDATKPDTDDDGTLDGDEDTDGDGLTNLEELDYETDPADADSDNDGLNDSEEINTYDTAPLKSDTDEDGADDGWEVSNDYDPLVYDDSFVVSESVQADNIEVSTTLALDGENVTSLTIEPVTNNLLLDETIPGYIGAPCNFAVEGEFDEATISIAFDESLLDDEDFEPTIYYFNEETQLFEELETTIEGNVATAVVNHFSVYILLNKTEFEAAWENDIKPPIEDDEAANATLDIVFVIDYSKSMRQNDPEQLFKTLSKEFVAKLRDGKDRAAVVKFIKKAKTVSELTTDKDILNNAIDSIEYDDGNHFDSGTNGSTGYKLALEELSESEAEYKYIIFITDGEDTYHTYDYNDLIIESTESNVTVYTIGMGNASETLLKRIAEDTGGKYYKSGLDNFSSVFDIIQDETIGYLKDSNEDGISDYHTQMLCDGEIRLSTCLRTPFDGCSFEKIQENADFDNDGLLNGEELVIMYDKFGGVYAWMRSNPISGDSDFDGIDDVVDQDSTSVNSNRFKGYLTHETDDTIYNADIDFIVDYSIFFQDNTKYHQELAELASLYALDMYDTGDLSLYTYNNKSGITAYTIGQNGVKFGKFFGMKDGELYTARELLEDYSIKVKGNYVDEDDVSEVAFSHQLKYYNGEKREIFFLTVRGTNGTQAEWSSNFDIGYDGNEYYDKVGKDHPDWRNKDNHKGFDVATNRILAAFDDYVDDLILEGKIDEDTKRSIFITGHSRGAAIANLLGAHFEDDTKYDSYVYTMATPLTTTASDADSYKTIFNIVNKDDLVTYLPLEDWGFGWYGQTLEISVKEKYEDSSPFGDRSNSFEGYFDKDYNANGYLNATVDSFKEAVKSRKKFYELDTTSGDGVVTEELAHTGDDYENFIKLLEVGKMDKYCETKKDSIVLDVYKIKVTYCPAYMAQNIANLAASDGLEVSSGYGVFDWLGIDLKGKYSDARLNFVLGSGKIPYVEDVNVGGMEHPHMPGTYYLITNETLFRNFAIISERGE